LKKKNEELTRELASKETLCKELNEKYETLKAQVLEEEEARQEGLKKQAGGQDKEERPEPVKEDAPARQDEVPPDKPADTDASNQDVVN